MFNYKKLVLSVLCGGLFACGSAQGMFSSLVSVLEGSVDIIAGEDFIAGAGFKKKKDEVTFQTEEWKKAKNGSDEMQQFEVVMDVAKADPSLFSFLGPAVEAYTKLHDRKVERVKKKAASRAQKQYQKKVEIGRARQRAGLSKLGVGVVTGTMTSSLLSLMIWLNKK